jgi:hypothetical protein
LEGDGDRISPVGHTNGFGCSAPIRKPLLELEQLLTEEVLASKQNTTDGRLDLAAEGSGLPCQLEERYGHQYRLCSALK